MFKIARVQVDYSLMANQAKTWFTLQISSLVKAWILSVRANAYLVIWGTHPINNSKYGAPFRVLIMSPQTNLIVRLRGQ